MERASALFGGFAGLRRQVGVDLGVLGLSQHLLGVRHFVGGFLEFGGVGLLRLAVALGRVAARRRVRLGRVFRDFDQQRWDFREQSADDSPFLIVELDFKSLSPDCRLRSSGRRNNLAVLIAQLSEPAKSLSFTPKASALLFRSAEGGKSPSR